MKGINQLYRELKQIKLQKQNFDSLENISIIQFIKYKVLQAKKEKVIKQIKKVKLYAKKIRKKYDDDTEKWIQNQKINCRKYSRLERKAKFKRDSQLYRLGYLKSRPLPPLFQKVEEKCPKINFPKFNYFKKVQQKYNFLKSKILPQKINKLAVNTAKICIKGFRSLEADYRFAKSRLSSNNSIRYFRNVIGMARTELDYAEGYSFHNEKEKEFRERLRVKPIETSIGGMATKGKHLALLTEITHNNLEL